MLTCCYLKCKALEHNVWFYRGTEPERVWVGAEHRCAYYCAYIPSSGESDWTLYQPQYQQHPKSKARLDYSKWSRVEDPLSNRD